MGDFENASGSPFADDFAGNDLSNVLRENGGNDDIDGGGGADTAAYSDSKSIYTITKTSTGYTVSGGSDGTDAPTEIEHLVFADYTANLATSSSTGGDGNAHFLWRHSVTGDVYMWVMNGSAIGSGAPVYAGIPTINERAILYQRMVPKSVGRSILTFSMASDVPRG